MHYVIVIGVLLCSIFVLVCNNDCVVCIEVEWYQ